MQGIFYGIDFEIYDCAEHGTPWAVVSKQDGIDNKISSSWIGLYV